ncbi:hypothetical protein CCR75_005793 [Bremia lactucae]|uniref:Uncharacterized protein n=1 Tax=Bremia lactucae TaxID=4779 RepID=A0A976FGX1_BRELC|nr:hypothetical protein CCR75_005793 [Bremia lactucae]
MKQQLAAIANSPGSTSYEKDKMLAQYSSDSKSSDRKAIRLRNRLYFLSMGSAVQNVMRPGSREFVIVLNAVLALLFIVMLAVIYTELEDSLHVFVLLFLVIGLTVSINWFIIEAKNFKHTQGNPKPRRTRKLSY